MTNATVRYIVDDVDAAIAFYTGSLDFAVELRPAPPFAILVRPGLRLLLSAPGGRGGGGQALPDGRVPEPGGWNRIVIEVDDLDARVASLRAAGVPVRSEPVTGVAGRQVLVDDPSGNCVELFEPIAS